MRTHVRIHFDRRNADLCEDNYISCIMSGSTGLAPDFANLPAAAAAAGMMPSSPPDMDQILKSLGIPADVCAKVLSSAAAAASAQSQGRPPSEETAASATRAAGGGGGASSLAGLQFLQLAQRMANHSPGPTTGAGCRSDKLFLCDLCCYSSSYRGNVIRHSKLVHGREISDVAVVSSNFLQQAVTGGKPMPPSASDAAHVKLLLSAAAEQQQQQQQHSPGSAAPLVNSVSAAAAAAAVVAARTPISASSSPTSGPMDESIQVKIDPEDLLLSMASHHHQHQLQLLQQHQQHRSIGTGSNHSSQSGHSPLASELTTSGSQGATATDPFRKHCKSCNITFTYMNTFLAHKKYYCSSHAPLGGGDQDHTGVEGGQEEEDMEDVDDDIGQRGNVVDDDIDSDPIHSPPPRSAHHSEATLT
jgi:zinc finger protein ZFPM1